MLTDSDRVDAATVRAGARDHIKKVKPDDDGGEEGHMKKCRDTGLFSNAAILPMGAKLVMKIT